MVSTYHGTPLSSKKEQTIAVCRDWSASQGHPAEEREQPGTGYMKTQLPGVREEGGEEGEHNCKMAAQGIFF